MADGSSAQTSGGGSGGDGGDAPASSSDQPTPPLPPALTQIKHGITPYLPPPVVNAMNTIDTHPLIAEHISPLTSDEPSTAIILSLVLAFVTLQFVRLVGSTIGGRSTLHVDDDEEYDVLKTTSAGTRDDADSDGSGLGKFGDTVALVGPCSSGKTVIFHSLCSPDGGGGNPQGGHNVITVTSMKASAGLVGSASDKDGEDALPVRLIDYPGHPSLRPKLASVVSASARIVLTLDSTRPVGDGAALLHSILTDATIASTWNQKVPILVACTRSDVPKSKNWRRIKIQLRTELERLEKVGGVTTGSSRGPGEDSSAMDEDKISLLDNAKAKGGGLDLDDLGEDIPASIHFLSVGGTDGLDALRTFVQDGTVPSTGK